MENNFVDVYTTNVEQFRAIGALPAELYFGNDKTVANFAFHSASWHKFCHLKINNSKLAKAEKKRKRATMMMKRNGPVSAKHFTFKNVYSARKGQRNMILKFQHLMQTKISGK